MIRRAIWLSAFGALALAMPRAHGEDWSQFRGPGASGVANGKDLPSEWSQDKNVLWKVKIGGRGWSQPVVSGDKVFITVASSADDAKNRGAGGGFGGGRPGGFGGPPGGGGGGFGRGGAKPPDTVYTFAVVCLDRTTGKELWKQTALEGKPKIATHNTNTYATETPITDGERVYAYFGMHGVYCFDMAGKQLWKKDLGSYSMMMGWGTASSPVLDGDKLFLQIDNEEKSFLVALNAKTGDEAWRVSRTERTNWGSPIVWKNKLRTEIVTPGSQQVRSYDPATGKQLWELKLGGGRCSASPTTDDDKLYVGIGGMGGGMGGGGFGGGRPGGGAPPGGGGGFPGGGGGRGAGGNMFAVSAGATGDITPKSGETSTSGVAWNLSKTGPAMASPLAYQGYIYILEQNGGMVTCIDAKTGKAAYTKERIPNARAFWASPWAYDGKIFCLDDGGTTHILKAGPEFKVLGKNSLGEQFWASPAIAGDLLILRGVDYVYAIKKK